MTLASANSAEAQFGFGAAVRPLAGPRIGFPAPFPVYGFVGPGLVVGPPSVISVGRPSTPGRQPFSGFRPVGAEFVAPFAERVEPLPKPIPNRGWRVIGPAFTTTDTALTPVGAIVENDPNANPVVEAALLTDMARQAILAEQYGRAVERLTRAISLAPAEPFPRFLLAQAEFARGKYAAAVSNINQGMEQAPNWPASGFRVKALFANPPDRLAPLLADLRQMATAHPNDTGLAFLLGHQLWFVGEKEEAVRHFKQAVMRLKPGSSVELFLKVAEAEK